MSQHPSEQLTAYADGSLPPDGASEIAAHLAECAHCHAVVEDLQAVRTLLRSLPETPSRSLLLPQTLNRLNQIAATRLRFPRWVVPAMVGAATLAFIFQLPALPPPHPDARYGIKYFQRQAEIAAAHPMADTTLFSYLSSTLPYELPEERSGR